MPENLNSHADDYLMGDKTAIKRICDITETRLQFLEKPTGANAVKVDNPGNAPSNPNPPPANPPAITVTFASSLWTVVIVAPQAQNPLSANLLSGYAQHFSPQGFGITTFQLQSSPDVNFARNVANYGTGPQHFFNNISLPGATFWRARCSLDSGATWGPWSGAVTHP